MGKRARRIQRAHDLRKLPNQPKQEFVARKVRELEQMDAELQAAMNRGGSPSELQGP